jgi:hypothetical protein
LQDSTALRIIYDSKEEEVKGGWRQLRNEGHNNLYSRPVLLEVIKTSKAGRECDKQDKKGICVQGFGWIMCRKADAWLTLA